MDRRRWLVGVLTGFTTIALLAACSSMTEASAPGLEGEIGTSVRYGDLDGDGHPFVGLMVAKNGVGAPMWRCSGTLISPTVFLTAGHCTFGATTVELWFAPDEATILGQGYPFTGVVSGTPATHPDYDPSAFFLADVGVVLLDAPVTRGAYGILPTLDELDALATRRGKPQVFTAVGYGLQRANPVFVEAALVRMRADPHLLQINAPGFTGDFSMLLSNNASTGGTCFGDSGGPNFFAGTHVVAGVTSYGINQNCAGTGGVYRMDRSAPLDWVHTFLGN